MKRPALVETVVFLVLFLGGVGLRLQFQDLPNFAPVAAMALFAGFFFRSRLVAIALPLAIMVVSDLSIGGYAWELMVVVYGMLVVPVACRGVLRRRFASTATSSPATTLLGLLGSSFAASVAFFLVTNLAVWVTTDMYERTASGLWLCYAAALPFFRNTLLGDMFFASLLFGSYVAAAYLTAPIPRDVPVTE